MSASNKAANDVQPYLGISQRFLNTKAESLPPLALRSPAFVG